MEHPILPLRDAPALLDEAAVWFSGHWGIPAAEYRESMARAVSPPPLPVPQWYVIADGGRLIAGAGVIENDFHDRPDLTPNFCALFVEPDWRCRGLAGRLLDFIRRDLGAMGIPRLYLVTDHTSFYEQYGWTFLTMVTGDDRTQERMYTAPALSARYNPPLTFQGVSGDNVGCYFL